MSDSTAETRERVPLNDKTALRLSLKLNAYVEDLKVVVETLGLDETKEWSFDATLQELVEVSR